MSKIDCICEYCDASFKRGRAQFKQHKHHYCSRECYFKSKYNKEKHIEIDCNFCGNKIVRVKSQYELRKNHFCSLQCVADYKSKYSSVIKILKYICSICNKEFSSKKKNRKYCSRLCANKGYSINHMGSHKYNKQANNPNPKFKKLYYCGECGKIVFRYDSNIKGKNVFCSKNCYLRYYHVNSRLKRKINLPDCKECGKKINNYKNKSGYCRKCFYELNMNSGEKNASYIEKIIIQCNWCGKDIHRRPSGISPNNFCNQTCMGFYKSENSPYRKIISVVRGCSRMIKWRNQALQNAKYRCEKCGVGGYLEVHHKTELYKLIQLYKIESLEDAYKCNALWDLSNGEALCLDCHGDKHERYFYRFRERETA